MAVLKEYETLFLKPTSFQVTDFELKNAPFGANFARRITIGRMVINTLPIIILSIKLRITISI